MTTPTARAAAREQTPPQPQVSRRLRSRLPFKIVDRYLFWQVAGATWRGFVWFAGLLLAVAAISAARKLVNNGLPFAAFLSVLLHESPRIVLFTLPMALLFGSAQTFSELSEKGEVTALYGGGLSLGRLLRAPLGWGVLLALLAACLQEIVVPMAQRSGDESVARTVLAQSKVRRDLRFEDPPANRGPLKSVLQASRFDPAHGVLTEPRFQIYNSDGRVRIEISAERARWNPALARWELFRGETVSRQGAGQAGGSSPDDPRRTAVVVARFEKASIAAAGPKLLGASTMNVKQHLEHGDFEVVSLLDLWNYRAQIAEEREHVLSSERGSLRKAIAGATYGIHDKIATLFLCFALVVVGVPLGVRPPRSGTGFAMGISIAVLLGYYGLWTWANTMATSEAANPVLMAYLPIGSLALTGAWLLWRKGH